MAQMCRQLDNSTSSFAVYAALHDAAAQGLVERAGKGLNKDPFR